MASEHGPPRPPSFSLNDINHETCTVPSAGYHHDSCLLTSAHGNPIDEPDFCRPGGSPKFLPLSVVCWDVLDLRRPLSVPRGWIISSGPYDLPCNACPREVSRIRNAFHEYPRQPLLPDFSEVGSSPRKNWYGVTSPGGSTMSSAVQSSVPASRTSRAQGLHRLTAVASASRPARRDSASRYGDAMRWDDGDGDVATQIQRWGTSRLRCVQLGMEPDLRVSTPSMAPSCLSGSQTIRSIWHRAVCKDRPPHPR